MEAVYVAVALVLFFLVGLFARFTDVFERNKRYAHFTLAASFAYGFGGGILAAISPVFASVVCGIVIGVLLGGKIDSRQHQLAVGMLFLTALLLNAAPLFVPLACFAIASFLDEDLHELISASKKRLKHSLLPSIFRSRVLVELAAVLLGVWTGEWLFFACVLAFDAGCYFVPQFGRWFPEH